MQLGSQRRAPSLLAQAEQQATEAHTRRLAELHQLAPLLDRLQPVLPALEAAELHVHPGDVSLARHYPDGPTGRALRCVRIHTCSITGSPTHPQRWIDTLLSLGFREVHRDSWDFYPRAVLQRGHLLLMVDAPEPAQVSAAAAAAKVKHQRRAEDAFAETEA